VTPRSASGKNRNAEQHRPSQDEAERGIDSQNEIAGLSMSEPVRSGEDVRRRGWFWHWNSIVTQYAPLIGLKGVGLLNSYTVWTDRRDESPHRGFAFPSQQSEADFYGEDRAELITINKILVALDLIEIRKVMVLRPDEQGRRYRAPHNLYRVKDHSDDYTLTAKDVLKVAELADGNAAVYRHVRKVFSQRFAPIDQNSPWMGILEEVRQTGLWQRLAIRTEREESRASARTKAGHASRRAPTDASIERDAAATSSQDHDSGTVGLVPEIATSVAPANRGLATSIEPLNSGSTASVESSNDGLDRFETTFVAPSNTARPTRVEPTNRTYNESTLTTTTTIPTDVILETKDVSQGRVTTQNPPVKDQIRPAPSDGPAQARAVRAFEDANDRDASRAERTLLEKMAERFDPAALRQSPLESGWSWIGAAVYEAVESGSAFVAPRRIREILTRWEREGAPSALARSVEGSPAPLEPERVTTATALVPVVALEPIGETPFMVEECGMPSAAVWAAVLDEMVANHRVSRADHDSWLRTTRLAGRGPNGELIVIAPNALAQRRILSRLTRPLNAAVASVIGRETALDIRIATSRPAPGFANASLRELDAQTG